MEMEHKQQGNLLKMGAELGDVVAYNLTLGGRNLYMNDLVGRKVRIEYLGEIHCIRCGRKTSRSFAQGYCYPCFTTAPETSECVLRPELCRAHEGISRDMTWSEGHCLQDHIVYLALASGLKVGVTRSSQVPVRWIDQGAWKAILLARTPNRYTAGLMEVNLKRHLSDKTNWRKMLTNEMDEHIDLEHEKRRAAGLLPDGLKEFVIPDDQIVEISYPVDAYPEKVKSLNLEKDREIDGTLTGIRGQYVIFTGGRVLNIRKHAGYLVSLCY